MTGKYLFSLADALEEVTDNNLCSYEWEHNHRDAKPVDGKIDQMIAVCENGRYCMGKSSQIKNPLLVITTPETIPSFNVCFTRSIFCAPKL